MTLSAPTLFVSGATGHLGSLVLDALRDLGALGAIVAGMRDPAKNAAAAAALTATDIEVRRADYAEPDTLATAFRGIDRLLLISGSENGRRREQHRNVIAAAQRAGVQLIAYTSILHADHSPLFLAEEHRDTETALAESGVPHVLLRNGWYNEVFTWRLPAAFARGVLTGAAGTGRVSAAARADYARAAATVLAEDHHAGRIYELAGDTTLTLPELAATAGEAAGTPLRYDDMPPETLRAAMLADGAPELVARIVSDTDAGIARGALFDHSGTLSRLIRRPTTPWQTTIAAFARGHRRETDAVPLG